MGSNLELDWKRQMTSTHDALNAPRSSLTEQEEFKIRAHRTADCWKDLWDAVSDHLEFQTENTLNALQQHRDAVADYMGWDKA